jgi:hypothetical protein
LIEEQEIDRVRELGLLDEVHWVHGVALASKCVGTIRLIYKNMNGICNRLSNNAKLEKAREIHNELEVDIAAYNEHWLNLCHHLNVNDFNQVRRQSNPSQLITPMKILVVSRRGGQVFYGSVPSQSTWI